MRKGEYMPIDQNILDAAILCQLAYREPPREISSIAAFMFFKDWKITTDALHFFVASDPSGRTWIVFRGTDSPGDWGIDIMAAQAPFFGGMVHNGFLGLYNQLKPSIGLPNPYQPMITGHSLGGALATVCAADMALLNPTVITFGSPRVGNEGFVDHFNDLIKESVRVANQRDPVPHLPPSAFLLSEVENGRMKAETIADIYYEHVDTLYLLNFTGQSGGVFGAPHEIANYIAALSAIP
jgi:triacylglycerol lipase